MQLGNLEADVIEGRDNLARRRQQEELARVGSAILQQCRCRIAAGIHLNGPKRYAGCLDIIAEDLFARIDRCLRAIPSILGIEPVGEQNNVLRIGVAHVFRGHAEYPARRQ